MEYVEHSFEPVYNNETKILILGTMPSPKSRKQGFYYGHPQNKMWRVLCDVLQCPLVQTIQEKKEFLLKHKIGMWDVLQSCSIQGADDSSIREEKPNDFQKIKAETSLQAIFTSGTKAHQLYGKYIEKQIGYKAQYLPSTSPANCGHYNLEKLIESYRIILNYL